MFPKAGNQFHHNENFATLMSEALRKELGPTHQAVKTAMRWTGASERSVKHWLAGTHAPQGMHIVALMHHSDEVLKRILEAADRPDTVLAIELGALHQKVSEMLIKLDRIHETGGIS